MPQVKTELEAARLRLEAAVNGPKMASREIVPGDGNRPRREHSSVGLGRGDADVVIGFPPGR